MATLLGRTGGAILRHGTSPATTRRLASSAPGCARGCATAPNDAACPAEVALTRSPSSLATPSEASSLTSSVVAPTTGVGRGPTRASRSTTGLAAARCCAVPSVAGRTCRDSSVATTGMGPSSGMAYY